MSRFFFAICPDKSIKQEILQCREQINLSGCLIKESNLHLTLLFLGQLNVNQLQKIIRQSEQITFSEFEIELNHSGYFKNSQVAWLGLESIPYSLSQLHRQLLTMAQNCDILSHTQSYKPHVTLARKSLPVEKKLIAPIKWSIRNFVLMESVDTPKGVYYQPVQKFM